jgi:hypothetical protein
MSNFLRNHLPDVKKRRTKPLDVKRKTAQDVNNIQKWFRDFSEHIIKRGIPPYRIWNFDNAGFRVGIIKGEIVYIPLDAPLLYTTSPENRKQVTLIEGINAAGWVLPPTIIIEGQWHIENWYNTRQRGPELVLLSETGYTNKRLGVEWLYHFIQHANL